MTPKRLQSASNDEMGAGMPELAQEESSPLAQRAFGRRNGAPEHLERVYSLAGPKIFD
jgi:hypothetical protein